MTGNIVGPAFYLYGIDGRTYGEFATAAEARRSLPSVPVSCCILRGFGIIRVRSGQARNVDAIAAQSEAMEATRG